MMDFAIGRASLRSSLRSSLGGKRRASHGHKPQRRMLQFNDAACDANYTLVGSQCVCEANHYADFKAGTSVTPATLAYVPVPVAAVAAPSFSTIFDASQPDRLTPIGTTGWIARSTVYSTIVDGSAVLGLAAKLTTGALEASVQTTLDVSMSQPLVARLTFALFGANNGELACSSSHLSEEGVVRVAWSADGASWEPIFFSTAGEYPVGSACWQTVTTHGFRPLTDDTVQFRISIDISGSDVTSAGYASGGIAGPGSAPGQTLFLRAVSFAAGLDTCPECPPGTMTNVGAANFLACVPPSGVIANNTINYVDLDVNESLFRANLPDYIQVLTYGENEDVFIENCPAGYYCLSDTTIPRACPAGTYRDVPGAESPADCFPCPVGSFCPLGAPTPTYCPAGSYRGTQGARSPEECSACLPGNFCPLGSVDPTNCSAGTYMPAAGAQEEPNCADCPPGRFCPQATATPVSCAAGTFRSEVAGFSQADSCAPCLAGSYCPEGSVYPTPCAAGTYRDGLGGVTQEGSCVTCPAGSFCPSGSQTPTPVAAGTFIGATGGQAQTDAQTCPAGFYCPSGSAAPTVCPSGTYNAGTGASQLEDCMPCTVGCYCEAGTTDPVECPTGTYRSVEAGEKLDDCAVCPTGQYCPVQSVTPVGCPSGTFRADVGAGAVEDCLSCPVGEYCPFSTTTPMHCPAGTYLDNSGGVSRSSCIDCPAGAYCPETSEHPTLCPAGTYRAVTGAGAVSDCQPCPSGQYCVLGTVTPVSCPAGTYLSTLRGAAVGDCVTCPAGKYCPERSIVAVDCVVGTYRPLEAGASQSDCTVCPTGHYCPTGSVNPSDCPPGTYNMLEGARNLTVDCLTCQKGAYCPVASTYPTQCKPGTYSNTAGNDDASDCVTCPAGAYCALGSTSPSLCHPGYHRDTPGATHLANCLLCLPGTYSLDSGRTSNCPICPANQYCRTSTIKETCPMHTTAPAGSYSRLNCVCDPGYSCSYYKQIQAIVTLNTTLSDFNGNVGNIKSMFVSAMAAAANVTSNFVVINGVASRVGRRLLSVGSEFEMSGASVDGEAGAHHAPVQDEFMENENVQPRHSRALKSHVAPSADGIKVLVSVANTGRLRKLESHLNLLSKGLHIAHRWEPAHKVRAVKIE